MRLVGDLVALHANVAHAGRRHQVEDAVDHAKARAQNGDDGELLAGKLLERGGRDGGFDFDILHGQVAHGLVAVKERELAYELAELVGAGALVAQDRQLMLDERMIDKRHARRIVGNGHGSYPFRCGRKMALLTRHAAMLLPRAVHKFSGLLYRAPRRSPIERC